MPPNTGAPRPTLTAESGSLWEDLSEIDVVEVVVDVEAPDLLPTYSYRIPDPLRDSLVVGTCVHVPFGGQERLGYVLERGTIKSSDPLARRLRDVFGIVEGAITFTEEQAAAAGWMAETYLCDLQSAIRCIAPASLGARVVKTARLVYSDSESIPGGSTTQAHILQTLKNLGGAAEVEALRKATGIGAFNAAYGALVKKGLIQETRVVSRALTVARMVRAYELGRIDQGGSVSAAGARILRALEDFTERGESPVLPEKLLTAAQSSSAALKTLVEKGNVAIREVAMRRMPHSVPAGRTQPPSLTDGQRAATERLSQRIRGTEGTHDGHPGKADSSLLGMTAPGAGSSIHAAVRAGSLRTRNSELRTENSELGTPTALLFGVTASGKTEVYLDAIGRTLDSGRSAIVLVPEIALTTQVVEVFTGRFGDEVAVLHSKLSEGERHDEWRRLQARHARIAVGARSAVFAPVENVGLIVVDEEHESSYKQEIMPRYNARDVARERARLAGAAVVLGSATPAIETYYEAKQGQIDLIEMPERIDNRPLPSVHLVDMREELREHRSLFSRCLLDRTKEQLAAGRQVILFLNRRGYSQFVLCRDCGYVARCPNCAVSLAFHAAWKALKCHHCGYGKSAPELCPSCGGTRIRGFGIGTEKVEEEVATWFPDARVARLDRDTTARKGAHAGILRRFREREADILIGTQMVAKGLDFPNVTLVGVISADTSINVPDFRAAERTFQLLTQVAGRAGRGEHLGEVVIQTFGPEHYSLQMAVRQDYPRFYEKEILFREELQYPPFRRFANLICSSAESSRARDNAQVLAAECRRVIPSDLEIIGPAPAPLAKLKNSYRWHVVLKAPLDAPLSEIVQTAIARLPTANRHGITVDIDPMSMA